MRIFDVPVGPMIDIPLAIIFGIIAFVGLIALGIHLLVKPKNNKSDSNKDDDNLKNDKKE